MQESQKILITKLWISILIILNPNFILWLRIILIIRCHHTHWHWSSICSFIPYLFYKLIQQVTCWGALCQDKLRQSIQTFKLLCTTNTKYFLKENWILNLSTNKYGYELRIVNQKNFLAKAFNELARIAGWFHKHLRCGILICPVRFIRIHGFWKISDWIYSRIKHHWHLVETHSNEFVKNCNFLV